MNGGISGGISGEINGEINGEISGGTRVSVSRVTPRPLDAYLMTLIFRRLSIKKAGLITLLFFRPSVWKKFPEVHFRRTVLYLRHPVKYVREVLEEVDVVEPA